MTTAYSYALAKEISVSDYSNVIFSAIFGWLLYHQIPDAVSVLGYGVIFLAAISMFRWGEDGKQSAPKSKS